MTTTVLAYIPSPPQGVWYLGPIPLRAYALCIIAGIVVALILGDRRWQARGGEAGVIYDIALWAVPFGLVGGRLYHVITDWPTYFGEDGAGFGAALRIWDGGLGIWGAVALGGIGAWIACRRRGIPLPAFGDAIAPGIVLAQAIGRLGNYFNQELYGRETTVPWGLEIFNRRDPSGYISVHSLDGISVGPPAAAIVHPTFLYELLWNVFVFAVLILVDKRFKIGHGRLFALYVAGYCVGRFWVELLRSDTATLIAGIRVNSFTSTLVFIGAVVYIMVAPRGREDPATLGKPLDEKDESVVDELAEQLTAAAATTGIVAAATVADREQTEESVGSDEPAEAPDVPPTEAEVLDAEVPELVVPAGVEPEEVVESVSVGDSGAVEEAVAAESSDADEVAEPEDAEADVDDAAVESEGEVEPVSVGDSGAVEEAVAAESSDAEADAVDADAVEDAAAVESVDEAESVSVGDSAAVEEAVAAESSDADEVVEPEAADAEAEVDAAADESEGEVESVSVGDSGAVEEAVAAESSDADEVAEPEDAEAEADDAAVESVDEVDPVSVGDSGAVEESLAAEPDGDSGAAVEPDTADYDPAADDAADSENEAVPVSVGDSGAVEQSVAAEDTEEPVAETDSTETETPEPRAADTPAQPAPAPREGRLRRLLRRRR